jgi:pentatricopeptide repeat protein
VSLFFFLNDCDYFPDSLQQASGKSDRHLDEIFVYTIKWPTTSRLSGFIDNSSVIADILSLLENETVYVAGFPVWKELIRRSASGAEKIPTRWEYVAKSFHYLSVAAPYYCPDHHLLQRGLEASCALTKPYLACELLRRAIVHYTPSPLLVMENPLLRRPHVPFQHFVNGISTCVKADDMKACEKILHIAKSMTMNPSNIRSLYVLALKGYANTGDVEKTVKILETMIAEKLLPGYAEIRHI